MNQAQCSCKAKCSTYKKNHFASIDLHMEGKDRKKILQKERHYVHQLMYAKVKNRFSMKFISSLTDALLLSFSLILLINIDFTNLVLVL